MAKLTGEKFIGELEWRRAEGLEIEGSTYHIRDEIKKAGGIWDTENKVWLAADADSLEKLSKKALEIEASNIPTEGEADSCEVTLTVTMQPSRSKGYTTYYWKTHNSEDKVTTQRPREIETEIGARIRVDSKTLLSTWGGRRDTYRKSWLLEITGDDTHTELIGYSRYAEAVIKGAKLIREI